MPTPCSIVDKGGRASLPSSTFAGLHRFLDGCLSFSAFWMAILPSPFYTSTQADKRLPLSEGSQMVQALPRGKEAMFARSTHCFGFWRPQLRIGGLSVPKLQLISKKSRYETTKRGWETKRTRECLAAATWVHDGYIQGICQVYTAKRTFWLNAFPFWLNTFLCMSLSRSVPCFDWVQLYPLILVLSWGQFYSKNYTHFD